MTTLFTLVALLFLGGSVLHDFAFVSAHRHPDRHLFFDLRRQSRSHLVEEKDGIDSHGYPKLICRNMSPASMAVRSFTFACHPGVPCFTDCCRMLELALTPYDVLRLRKATGLTSRELLENYIITEQDPGEPFPRFYLTMVDDGRASCVFVSPQGCTVYPHRPSACRAYPLGRAAVRVGQWGNHWSISSS